MPGEGYFVPHELELGGEGYRVAQRNQPLRLLLVLGADVYPQLMELGDLIPFASFQEVDRLPAHHARHRPVFGVDDHLLAYDDGDVHPSYRLEVDEPLIRDVAHGEANFIAVAREHHPRLALGVFDRYDVAVDVRPHLVGVSPLILPDDPLGRPLKTRRAGCVEELPQELKRLPPHHALPSMILSRSSLIFLTLPIGSSLSIGSSAVRYPS